MRAVSNTIAAVLNDYQGETKDVIEIFIKAQVNPPSPETTLYYANGEGIVIDGQEYENKLRSLGQIKFSLSSSPDSAEVKIENVSRELGFVLTNQVTVFDGATITIKRAFKIADGSWEPYTLFVGQITDTKVDQESIIFTVTSDMSKRGTNVADRAITQRCIWRFNVNGSGIGPHCGWQTSQPGNPLSCDLTLEGENGCRSHGNTQRFGGVPAFTIVGENNGYDPNNGGGWGWGGGGGWCVHPLQFILCESAVGRYYVRAMDITQGETIVSLDKFGHFVQTKVVNARKGVTTQLYTLTTKEGFSIQNSPSHPIITSFEDENGTPCHKLKVGDSVLVTELHAKKAWLDYIESIEVVDKSCNVILLELEEPYHIFGAGTEKDKFILSHNAKPIQ